MDKERKNGLTVVVLAAGKGTRMKSAKAKVLHDVFYQPMVHHVLAAVEALSPDRIVVIVGHQQEEVRATLSERDLVFVEQREQLGTGHAVLLTEDVIPQGSSEVLILCGDTPLISTSSLMMMQRQHRESAADLTVMTTRLANPFGYGRIVTTNEGNVCAIVEEKECSEEQEKIDEVNSGIYLVDRDLLFEALKTVTPDNTQGEFYLTDIVAYAVSRKRSVQCCCNADPMEVLGVNSRVELEAAHNSLRLRRNVELMQQGVSLEDRASVAVALSCTVGMDSRLLPGVCLQGNTQVGKNCCLENGVLLSDCRVEDNAYIGAYSVLRGCHVKEGEIIAPATVRTS